MAEVFPLHGPLGYLAPAASAALESLVLGANSDHSVPLTVRSAELWHLLRLPRTQPQEPVDVLGSGVKGRGRSNGSKLDVYIF